jgi:hypothetical protein
MEEMAQFVRVISYFQQKLEGILTVDIDNIDVSLSTLN